MKIIPILFISLFLISCQNKKETQNEETPILRNENVEDKLEHETEITNIISGLNFPEWLDGGWHNSTESNTNNFVFYVFGGNELRITKGMSFLNEEKTRSIFKNYEISEKTKDSAYIINFNKGKLSVNYEFKLQKVDWEEEPILTCSISENGELIMVRSTSMPGVLIKVQPSLPEN